MNGEQLFIQGVVKRECNWCNYQGRLYGKTEKKDIWADLRCYSVLNPLSDAKGKGRLSLKLRH